MNQIKEMLDFMKSAKAYVGTLVAIGGILLTLSADENFQSLGIPDTVVGKIAGVGTLLVTFGAIFGVRNRRTVSQATDDLKRAREAKPAAKKASPRKRVASRRRRKVVGTSQVPTAPAVDTPKLTTDDL